MEIGAAKDKCGRWPDGLVQNGPVLKPQHWCGLPGKNACRAAPVLEFEKKKPAIAGFGG